MKRLSLLFGCFLMFAAGYGQSAVKQVRKGNSAYEKKNFKDAEINYRKSLQKDSNYFKGKFNLGDALYKQKQFGKAAGIFQDLSVRELDKKNKARVFHNLGNALLQDAISSDTMAHQNKQEQIQKSISAYKNALRNLPEDNETKYNLEYAKKMLTKLQQQQQQKQQQQQQQQQQKKDQNKNQEQQQKQKISKQDAEKMLEALKNDEQKTQEKLQKQKAHPVKFKNEKDW